MSIEAMKLALEYLQDNQHLIADNERHSYVMEYNAFIEHFKKAIEQEQKQEPVAWGFQNLAITGSNRWMMLREEIPANDQYDGALWTPLYTSPTQREWVGLTPDEFKFIASKYLLSKEAGIEYFQEEVEAKLKEKNT